MINTGWTHDVDMLAQNGILDYDASAYLTGNKARFAGTNPAYVPPLGTPMQPDQFIKSGKKNPSQTPTWKKVLAGVLVAGVAFVAGRKLLPKIGKGIIQLLTKVKKKP